MQQEYSILLLLILNSGQPIDALKELCENFLEQYCNQEGMILYSELIRLIAEKQKIVVE